MEEHELLTVNEVAELFRVDKNTIYTWLRTGKLTKITLPGGVVRLRRVEVRGFIEVGNDSPE